MSTPESVAETAIPVVETFAEQNPELIAELRKEVGAEYARLSAKGKCRLLLAAAAFVLAFNVALITAHDWTWLLEAVGGETPLLPLIGKYCPDL